MSQKILLAVDGSQRGFEAVSIVGNLIKDHPATDLIIFHCLPQLAGLLPGELCVGLEGSGLLTQADQERVGRMIFEESRRRLLAAGFPESRVEFKLKAGSIDPAQDIQAEAENGQIPTIAVGRRGLSQVKSLLLGSISSKVAQYALQHSVWVVDTPVPESKKVLVPVEGAADAQALTTYLAEAIAPISGLEFTFLHLMPPIPPTFWDDGHILGSTEQVDRRTSVEKWRTECKKKVEKFLADGRTLLMEKGVAEKSVRVVIQPVKEGIARDLLNEVVANKFELVVMGKRSFSERKPFLMGSHANKILQNLKGAILCLVDSR
jgi:nucleotide-binding universal stress UspA family protein